MNKINEFKKDERVYGDFLVRTITKGVSSQSKEYLDISLADKTGSILGKVWDIGLEAEKLEVGMVAYATGIVTEWQGKQQLRIEHIEQKRGEYRVEDFVETVPMTRVRMEEVLDTFILDIGDIEIRDVVTHIVEPRRDEFFKAPAARGMHHALYGGLAYHTVTMLQVAKGLANIYPFIRRDLLFAGVILHDIAKLDEMAYEFGAVSDYTRPGQLLGHIVQGTLLIERAAIECGTSERTKEALQHLVVSHHGKAEWGSPQPPRMPEAVLLHFIDNIDAKMFMVKELMDKANGEEMTEYHRGLEGKLFIF